MSPASMIVSAIGTALALTATASAQESASSAKAAVLTRLLDQQKLEAVAARDPDQPGRFVAALYYPGSQLLAVSAAYPVPALLEQLIAAGKYRDVYMDLQVPAVQTGRFLVMDLQADGLRRSPEKQVYDITYESGANKIVYDGNWKDQNITQAKYEQRFRSDDDRYARMLAALERELAQASSASIRRPTARASPGAPHGHHGERPHSRATRGSRR
jgi:hypothetical protein